MPSQPIAIRIITIEREYGCGGREIACQLAGHLGWKLWDQLLTCEIARLTDSATSEVERREEQLDPLYYRLFKSILRGSFEGSLNLHRLKLLDADRIFRSSEQIIHRAAEQGNCVIVGRGSQHFLRDRADTLRIFLFAPRNEKVNRLKQEGIEETQAEELVDNVDKERAAFVEKYFHLDWPDRSVYHAMLNTATGNETVIRAVLNLKSALDRKNTSDGETHRLVVPRL